MSATSSPAPDHHDPANPWIRLVMVMAVPVLLLLAEMSLTR